MDFARQVKGSVDIVDTIGEFVRLKKQGSQRFVGLCPFHTEKTPSFSVHAGLQIYKCFGCGQSGDVFNFLMELQGLTFYEALQTLADRQGIPMPRGNAGSDADSMLRDTLLRMHETAQAFFQERLPANAGARARELSALARTLERNGGAIRHRLRARRQTRYSLCCGKRGSERKPWKPRDWSARPKTGPISTTASANA